MNLDLSIQTVVPVREQIERFLRSQIQRGFLSPGSRLPPTNVLARKWNTDHTAIQRAMTRLVAQGLIERRPRRGTFVKSQSSKAVIGVLVGLNLSEETAYFYRALVKHLRLEIAEKKEHNWVCRVYDDLYAMEARSGSDAIASLNLATDLNNYAFKGIIQIYDRLTLKDPHLMKDLPSVHIFDSIHSAPPDGVPDMIQDIYRFGYEAVELLARKGMQPIVYLRTLKPHSQAPTDIQGIHDAATSRGLPEVEILQLPADWDQGSQLEQTVYQKTLELIAQWRQNHRWPQAVLISDDIATRALALALLATGVPADQRPFIVTLANEGIVHNYGLPVLRYEFSPSQIAHHLIQLLSKRMLREPLPALPLKVTGRWQHDASLLWLQ